MTMDESIDARLHLTLVNRRAEDPSLSQTPFDLSRGCPPLLEYKMVTIGERGGRWMGIRMMVVS